MLGNIFQSFAKKVLTKLILLCNNKYKLPNIGDTNFKGVYNDYNERKYN